MSELLDTKPISEQMLQRIAIDARVRELQAEYAQWLSKRELIGRTQLVSILDAWGFSTEGTKWQN